MIDPATAFCATLFNELKRACLEDPVLNRVLTDEHLRKVTARVAYRAVPAIFEQANRIVDVLFAMPSRIVVPAAKVQKEEQNGSQDR